MTLFRTVEPEHEPVTLVEVKQHLRLSHDSEDELLEGLVRAARQEVENSTGLALMDQAWRCVLDRVPASLCVPLRRHPIREISAITLYGPDGEAALLDPAGYQLDALSRPARLVFLAPVEAKRAMNGIEIDFTAGFGESGADVPDLLKRAMLLLVAHWYEFRASFGARQQPVSFPAGYDRLIAPFRMRGL
ncbi:head-tail connector protein [Aquamicrobium sp. LC103]|uniref:head-tail connector protein n=1 Tax=Aquamicrobium sp. LC103 TaxID=1120658 RepID=UPI00063EBB6A|nr:head-tail connector protein [Aquamicrobium sp. LC103]TKT81226.1 hypothetical protein XW59_004990 [Aquamicrobium sp. LC103]